MNGLTSTLRQAGIIYEILVVNDNSTDSTERILARLSRVDGSVRYLKYGTSTWPINMWAVSEADRTTYAFVPP